MLWQKITEVEQRWIFLALVLSSVYAGGVVRTCARARSCVCVRAYVQACVNMVEEVQKRGKNNPIGRTFFECVVNRA